MKTFLALAFVFLLTSCTSHSLCKEIAYHDKHALNIVLFPDGFSPEMQAQLGAYFVASLKGQEPFTSKPYFNVYLIENVNRSICKPFRPETMYGGQSRLPPLNCSVAQLVELVATCNIEKGKIIILTEDNVASQTSVTYSESGVIFLDMKNQPPEIIQHEFAHLFGLVDEKATLVSYALGPGREPAPNCVKTKAEAEQWERFYPENHMFPQGCAGNPTWYKPEDQTLLSNLPDPHWSYGRFNEWYLGTIMDCCYAKNRTAYSCDAFFAEFPEWNACRT